MAEGAPRGPAGAPGVASFGMSLGQTSGMRDHARLLAEALPELGIPCSLHWLAREQRGLAGARREVAAWARELEAGLREERPRALVMHYASFAYAHRGIPLFLGPALRAARRSGTPLIALMHELAYPLRGGVRGHVWAATQRAALAALVRASAAVIVTTEERVGWLHSRRWLPDRPAAFAPVYSNLPPPAPGVQVDDLRLGLFGYAYEGANGGLVLDALARLRRDLPVRLELLGAPGPGTPTAEAWLGEAQRRGVREAIAFSGRLPAQELSDALAGCAVLLCAASPGPTSRKGTLAGSLASGRPVVAIDGHLTWRELIEQDAARVVARRRRRARRRAPAPARQPRRARRPRGPWPRVPRAPHGRRAHGRAGQDADRAGGKPRRLIRASTRSPGQVMLGVRPAGALAAVQASRAAAYASVIAARWRSSVNLDCSVSRPARPIWWRRSGSARSSLRAPRQRPRVARGDHQPGDAVVEPVADATGPAGHRRAPGGEPLDADDPERLRPQGRHGHDRGVGELLRERVGRQPAGELDAVLDAEAPGQAAHRRQLPAVAADDEGGLHLAGGAHERGDALRRHHAPGEHDARRIRALGGRRRGNGGEVGHQAARRDPVDRHVPVDRGGVGDGHVGQPQSTELAAGEPVGAAQRQRVAGVRTAQKVGYAPGPVGPQAFLAGAEVVHAGGARDEAVGGDHHRRGAAQVGHDGRVSELVEVNDRGLERERLADPRLHRSVAVEQLRALEDPRAGRDELRFDPRGEDRHTRSARRQGLRAGADVGRHAAVPDPARDHHKH